VKKVVEDVDAAALRNLAEEIRKNNDLIILFGGLTPEPGLVFACSKGVPVCMGEILKEAAVVMGAHGGGGEDFAQGGGGNAEMIQDALDKAEALVKEKLQE
jgi:alanyl-tRNA synthetase